MTADSEWRDGRDPLRMLEIAVPWLTQRQLQLFACACCHRIWSLIPNPQGHRCVEVAEAFADGLIDPTEVELAIQEIAGLPDRYYQRFGEFAKFLRDEESVDSMISVMEDHCEWAREAAPLLACYAALKEPSLISWIVGAAVEMSRTQAQWKHVFLTETAAHCDILRDILGESLDPVVSDTQACVRWRNEATQSLDLSRMIYQKSEFRRLPELADALIDDGFPDSSVIEHCRGDGLHVRGCWALDLVLGAG